MDEDAELIKELDKLYATCETCGHPYDKTDESMVKYHTEPYDCGGCGRCDGRPQCYDCHGMWCYCTH